MITKPTITQLFDKLKADLYAKFPTINQSKINTFHNALMYSIAVRLKDGYNVADDIVLQSFLTTATGTTLEKRAAEFGVTRNPATQAEGFVNFGGLVDKIIPVNTIVKTSDNLTYETQSQVQIAEFTNAGMAISYDNNVATIVFSENHNLSTNIQITVSGATETALNGTFDISLVDATTIQYDITVGTSGNDTGDLTYNLARGYVISDEYGADQNQSYSVPLTLDNPIAGVNNEVGIEFSSLGGGADVETDEGIRYRALQKKQNPATNFNIATVTNVLLELSWVSKVFILPATPARGKATIYILKEGNVEPSDQEIDLAKAQLEPYVPINNVIGDILFEKPTIVAVDFDFASVSPDNASIKTAVENNLKALFEEKGNLGQSITQVEYTRAILSSVNPDNPKEIIEDYTLTSPTGDLIANSDEILTLGVVTWS